MECFKVLKINVAGSQKALQVESCLAHQFMNIDKHPIYRQIYNLCQEIEKLPASEQATRVVIMASDLEKPVSKLLSIVEEIKSTALKMTDPKQELPKIVKLCIDAGIPSQTGVQKFKC